MDSVGRIKMLKGSIILVVAIIILRLFLLQVVDDSYKESANNNTLRRTVQYPPRGDVYDRNGNFLVQSREAYDLMAIPRDVKPFDTLLMSRILEVDLLDIRRELQKARSFSPRRSSVIFKELSKEIKLRLDEYNFPGFYTIYRTIRYYPSKMAGNLLGYISEVNANDIEKDPYYRSGDYVGKSGIELAYESVLRGEKGVKVELVDVHGMPQGSYSNGDYDTLPSPGVDITCTIHGGAQALAEKLLEGKVGSVVAIEPSTGEILVMASSPTYDPDGLVGRDRNNNLAKMYADKRRPMFNRAVMAGSYSPGSTFKMVQGLIAQQEGLLVPSQTYSCHGGYPYGRGVKCHSHIPVLDLEGAVQNSCNAYFCYVFQNMMESKKYANIKEALDMWADYVRSFGYGRKLDTDFIGEHNGNVPDAAYYTRTYGNSWRASYIISLSIGQGELGCTPLQMANFAATIANRGYYYIPHVVKRIHDRDSLDARFYERHVTKVEPKYFEPMVAGMYKAVHEPGGTATWVSIPGIDMCGKTGTAQNPHGADNSTFMSFAPRENPRIAISVYVEQGGGGSTVAAPIASLITELYLTDTIKRQYMVDAVLERKINYPVYDK